MTDRKTPTKPVPAVPSATDRASSRSLPAAEPVTPPKEPREERTGRIEVPRALRAKARVDDEAPAEVTKRTEVSEATLTALRLIALREQENRRTAAATEKADEEQDEESARKKKTEGEG